jgi:uncharacterized delta-60 repeat protein
MVTVAAAVLTLVALVAPVALGADGAGMAASFGDGGLVVTDMGGADDTARGVVIDGDGRVTVVGEARPNDQSLRGFAIARYTPEGALDAGFGDGGRVYTAFNEFQGSGAQAAAVQPDGELVVVGFGRHPEVFHDTFAIARYDASGSLDPGFGDGGQVLTAVDPETGAGRNDIAHAVAIDPYERIVVAGETGALFKDIALVRYLPDGSLDPGFGDGGIVVTDLGGDDRANAVAVAADGSVLVAGSGWQMGGDTGAIAENFGLVRYAPDGSLDPGFGDGGVVTTDFRGGSDRAFGVAIRTDGSIVAGGTAQLGGGCSPSACERYGFGLASYTAAGVLDPAFGDQGLIAPDFVTSSGGYALALLDDGTVALAGHVGNEDFGLLFATSAGGLLPLEGGEAVRIDFNGGPDRAFGVAAAPDGSVLLAGDAGSSDGAFDFALAAYRPPED